MEGDWKWYLLNWFIHHISESFGTELFHTLHFFSFRNMVVSQIKFLSVYKQCLSIQYTTVLSEQCRLIHYISVRLGTMPFHILYCCSFRNSAILYIIFCTFRNSIVFTKDDGQDFLKFILPQLYRVFQIYLCNYDPA